jgi:Domain of unknown function (DUF4307)
MSVHGHQPQGLPHVISLTPGCLTRIGVGAPTDTAANAASTPARLRFSPWPTIIADTTDNSQTRSQPGVSDITDRKRDSALTPEKHAQTLAIARYGVRMTRRGKITMIICVTIIAAAALTGLLWIALYQANPPVRGTLLGYEVTSNRAVEVRFEVWRRPGVTAQCVVRARNAEGVEVGSRLIIIPAGERRVIRTEVLETRSRAVSGELKDCRQAASG